MKNIVYEIGTSLYINATNRCSNACTFCVRNNKDFVYGDLWLDSEPTAEEIVEKLKEYDLTKYNELVFCGYGEPTYRMDVIEVVSKFAHNNGLKTRINTNGHANLINDTDVTGTIVNCIDTIGVSLNEVDESAYDSICLPMYENAYQAMIDFARECVEKGGNVVFSVVDVIGKEKIEKAKEIAASVGAKLRIRELISD